MASILDMYVTYFDPLVKEAYQTKTTNLIAGTTVRSGEKGEDARFAVSGKFVATRLVPGAIGVPQQMAYAPVTATVEDFNVDFVIEYRNAPKLNIDEARVNTTNAVYALDRAIGQIIINALESGYDDTNMLLDHHSDPMSTDIISEAKGLLRDNAVSMDELTIVGPAKMQQDMEDDTTWTNFLTNDYRPLVSGSEVKKWMGVNWEFVPSSQPDYKLPAGSNGGVMAFLFDKKAIGTFIGKIREVHVADTPQYHGYYHSFWCSAGAVVIDDKGIVGIELAAA
jgi:hypothetical protein